MDILTYLIPVSLILAGVGLAAFFWALRSRQFDYPLGDASRILKPDWEEHPKP